MERFTKEKTFAIIDEKLKSIREKFQKDQQMDMAEFYDLFTRSNELIHVVDCRSQEEFDECHISGAYTLADYYGHTEWRGLPIRAFFYSRIGERSAAAVEEALKQGIKAYNVNGGLIEWLHYNGYCDFRDDGKEKRVNVVDKEFAPMVPEGMTPVFREDCACLFAPDPLAAFLTGLAQVVSTRLVSRRCRVRCPDGAVPFAFSFLRPPDSFGESGWKLKGKHEKDQRYEESKTQNETPAQLGLAIGVVIHYKIMNPVVYQRLLRSCVFPVKNVGFLLRKSSFTRRAFSSLALGKRGSSHVRIAAERGAALFSSPASRHFATAAESSSNLSIYVTGVVASAVIGGGIYYYSLSLKKSPIFQEALSLLNRSELVREVLGSSVRSISLARGSMKKEVSTITFIIRGESGEYLVSLVAKKVDEKLVIDTLSFHKRSQVPVYEYYVIRDGEVVTELDPEKKEEEVVETMEEPELKEAFDEKKL